MILYTEIVLVVDDTYEWSFLMCPIVKMNILDKATTKKIRKV